MNWIKQRPIAHRGLHRGFDIPENSMRAFNLAIKNDYAIELDVRFTKDNQVIVFHDKNLIRLCGVRKKVKNQTYKAIKYMKLYNTNETIPLLKDVLTLISGKVPVIVEIKNYTTVGVFEECIVKELDSYPGSFSICSFSHHSVNWFKKNRPDFKRGLIFGDIKKFSIKFYKTVFLYRFFKIRPDFISLDYKLIDSLIVMFCKRLNIPIVSWTVNNKRKLKKARNIVDNFIFENIKP
jgi:glycerophosphoryl diester phosphodiesterase